jgi:hypothetical protein
MMGRKGVSIVFFFFFLSHVITLILYYVDIWYAIWIVS